MPGFLLDTNTLSDLLRNPGGTISARVAEVGPSKTVTSIIVAAELRYGAEKKASARLAERIEELLTRVRVLPFEAPAERAYGRLRAHLERDGNTLGANDLFIAAHALSLGLILVTDNTREFSRVTGLTVENWLR
jgi:tRNA(fMet)-specific endonuclease VapC